MRRSLLLCYCRNQTSLHHPPNDHTQQPNHQTRLHYHPPQPIPTTPLVANSRPPPAPLQVRLCTYHFDVSFSELVLRLLVELCLACANNLRVARGYAAFKGGAAAKNLLA